jgi:hypothetical protein
MAVLASQAREPFRVSVNGTSDAEDQEVNLRTRVVRPSSGLLVEDDAVSRKLFIKFSQISGCTIDVAVDGVGAVNKMNLESTT